MNWLLHYFTPHHTNNHRPRALHPGPLVYYIIFFLLLQLSFRTIHVARPYILGVATDIRMEELLKYTNEERQKQGLSALTINPTLSSAAAKKAQNMFLKDYWAHTAPDGATPWDFIIGSGYKYLYAGENLARDFSYSKNVVDAWMNSPSHRENILRSEYKEIGFAVVNGKLNGEDTTLVVQMFGTPTPQVVAAKPVVVPHEELATAAAPVITSVVARQMPMSGTSLGVVKAPAFDQFATIRIISLIVIGVLLSIIALDGFVILHRRTIRIAGHNLAHFIFLVSVAGIILLSTSGAIM